MTDAASSSDAGVAVFDRDHLVRLLARGRRGGQRSDVAINRALGGDHDYGPAIDSDPRVTTRALAPGEPVDDRPKTPAAVLVPLIQRPEGTTVLLTQRTAHLKNHAGQISFPGGRCEEVDDGPVATALRESHEEIGLAPGLVDVLGHLDDYITVTGFAVTPVVGLVAPPFDLEPDPFEVAEVFEVPLAFVLEKANHERHTYQIKGRTRAYYAMPYQGRYIWGATAGMLVNLAEVLRP
ncbi:putative nudix hydrolase YeaB [Caenispirillum salinarum AK4]|uniref:Putative nudix hydrolase YeaB n=1 Tax=Caenispirillum salinarum AK4 TaxID=1238182 RepID=K9GKT0_9PROT|nr:CoA pyrophosphatase [Caenispirillum salinarum]EKV26610.1 putative nudix hydrolase YeaB [Caenispirillum salinarum AK4]